MNELTTTANSTGLIFNSETMHTVMVLAESMSKSAVSVPEHFKNKQADCMAIVLQALQWGMSPYQVAQQTSLINGALAYGAQLVNAVISSSTAIVGRFHYQYSDGWERLAGKVSIETVTKNGKTGTYEKSVPTKKWTAEDEAGLWIKVGAIPRGETEIEWSEKLYLASVLTRNSPEWITDPAQQISYLGVKKWGRKYAPAVLLGVYTQDEFQPEPERDVTPQKTEKKSALRLSPVADAKQEEIPAVVQHKVVEQDVAATNETVIEAEPINEEERKENLADILFAFKKSSTQAQIKQASELAKDHCARYPDDTPELAAARQARINEIKNNTVKEVPPESHDNN